MAGPIKNPPTWPPIHLAQRLVLSAELLLDWWHKWLNAPELWKLTEGSGVTWGVLDTGIDDTHVCFQGAIGVKRDFTNDRRWGYRDRNGHGTFCASVLGGRGDFRGVAPKCTLNSYKVLNNQGEGTEAQIAAGIDQAIADKCDGISMSLGASFPMPLVGQALDRAIAAGMIVVAAAGNDGGMNTVGYPAAWAGGNAKHGQGARDAIAVGAIDRYGQSSPFSSRGKQVDTVAPGSGVLGAAVGGGHIRLDGTSMATPLVAGGMACALAYHRQGAHKTPLRSTADARDHIKRSAIDAGAPGHDATFGFGYYNPLKQVQNDPPQVEPPAQPPTAPIPDRQVLRLGSVEICIPARDSDQFKATVGTVGINVR